MLTTRTSSPYFSPNSAIAPRCCAASNAITSLATDVFANISAFTAASIVAISSTVIGAE